LNEALLVPAKVCTACGARYPGDALYCAKDGTPLQTGPGGVCDEEDPYLGQEISGHIEIRQLVGIGAMGRVYRAFQRGIDRDVAVKILHRELSANAQLVTRFTREAKVASRLQHPNVVQVLLAGQLPDRALYMVMEYLDGMSLQSALAAAGGALPLPRALHIALQLCEAAGEAHAQGIVHRDLKPENVMLVRRGADQEYVKVLDFGIARFNWGEQSVATAAGLIFGTARYISPEGAQGNAVGPASDVYSIAILLYQMLAGRTPFEGDQAVGLLVQQIHDAPPQLKSLPRAAYVPDPIAEVVMANLAKDPGHREPDARALGHAILDAAKAAGLSSEEISRPHLRRQPSAMKLPPMERTKQLDLGPELQERLTPSHAAGVREEEATGARANGTRVPMGATAKWEPPGEFQARLADAVGSDPSRASGVVPSESSSRSLPAAPGRARASSVDETLDDASYEPTPSVRAVLASPPGTFPAVPHAPQRTMPGDAAPSTHYEAPAAHVTVTPPPRPVSEPHLRPSAPSHPAPEPAPLPRSSRGALFVVLCFLLGMLIAAGVAWKMGKLGGEPDEERFVARATDAMFKNRFDAPPGDNVRDITNEGLRRWPNERRLVDIRIRAANELVSQAQAQRSAGDVAEALRLARVARDLDPHDPSARRLVELYESELSSFTTETTPPLPSAEAAPRPTAEKTAAPPGPSAPAASKVVLDVSTAKPRLGQTVELTAKMSPSKGKAEEPAFTITGPGLGAGVRMPAQSPSPGIFKGSYAFLEAGRFEVVFVTTSDGKPLHATRRVDVGPAALPGPAATPPPTSLPPPTPSASVKWL
jgi:eukaryotic-like serine/threonine-protein kinase